MDFCIFFFHGFYKKRLQWCYFWGSLIRNQYIQLIHRLLFIHLFLKGRSEKALNNATHTGQHCLSPKQRVLAVSCTTSDKCDRSKLEVPNLICPLERDEEKVSQNTFDMSWSKPKFLDMQFSPDSSYTSVVLLDEQGGD